MVKKIPFRGKSSAEATREVIDVMLPQVMDLVKAGKLNVENVDVFCEKGAFSLEESREILAAARKNNLSINFHGEELVRLNSAEVSMHDKRH